MATMTSEQRRARILELETELAQLRAEELAQPAAAAQYFEKVWHDLRIELLMTKEEYMQFLDKCRAIKLSSPARAVNHFRNKMEVTMQQAADVIRRL